MSRKLQFTIYNLQFLLLVFLVFPARVLAQGNELLPAGQVIESDYIRAGNTVQVDGEIRGDAFLAGGIVTVNGKIDGDLFVAAGKVNLNGTVVNSVRILAGDVVISGPVGRNILLVCGNCSVTKQATVAGSLLVAGGNLEVSAPKIGKGFRFLGSRLFLNSDVASEAFVVADREFLLGPQASISGNLKYTGSTEAVLEPGATVAGNISYQKKETGESYPRFFGAKTILESYKKVQPLTEFLGFFVSALVGFILLGLFPRGFEKVTQAIEKRPYASLGWGLIAVVAIPVLTVLFALTIIGLPVAVLLALVFSVVLLGAQYLAAFFVGRRIMLAKFGERRGWAIVLGLFLFYLLGLIPVLGNLIKAVLVLLALGATILAYKQPAIIKTVPLPSVTASSKRGRPAKR